MWQHQVEYKEDQRAAQGNNSDERGLHFDDFIGDRVRYWRANRLAPIVHRSQLKQLRWICDCDAEFD